MKTKWILLKQSAQLFFICFPEVIIAHLIPSILPEEELKYSTLF